MFVLLPLWRPACSLLIEFKNMCYVLPSIYIFLCIQTYHCEDVRSFIILYNLHVSSCSLFDKYHFMLFEEIHINNIFALIWFSSQSNWNASRINMREVWIFIENFRRALEIKYTCALINYGLNCTTIQFPPKKIKSGWNYYFSYYLKLVKNVIFWTFTSQCDIS